MRKILFLFTLWMAILPCRAFTPQGTTAPDGEFTFDMIQNWTGEGENQAALVLQWDDLDYALVFGFKWTGDATYGDMVENVVKNNPQLYFLWGQHWSGTGFMVSGWGWDDNADGNIGITDGSNTYTGEDGWIENTNQMVWDFSKWTSIDDNDIFKASSNWQCYYKDEPTAAFASKSFTSTRSLNNGMMIGFVAYGDNEYTYNKAWKPFASAPSGKKEALIAADGEFPIDEILNWTGTGSNKAALAIQWADSEGRLPNALVFGYRWDGTATNMDMVEAIIKNNPRLYALWSAGWTSGFMIRGWGWDADNDGAIGLYDSTANKEYDDPEGWYQNPDQYAWTFDNWEALDFDGDVFQASSNWNYFTKAASTDSFVKNSMGFSESTLTDGGWIGFIYAGDNDYSTKKWSLLEAAPQTIVEEVKTDFEVDGVCYHLINQFKNEVEVCAPFEGSTTTTYTGEIAVAETFVDGETTYTVIAVGIEAFSKSNVTKVTLPKSIKMIGNEAFAGSSISSVNLENVKTIGTGIFAGCANITEYCLPEQITEIPAKTFAATAITELSIPAYVTNVGEQAFADCQSLASVFIPKTLNTIASEAFSGCDNLATVKVETMEPMSITADVFSEDCYENATLQLPIGASSAYSQASGWSRFRNLSEYTMAVAVGDKFTFEPYTYEVTKIGAENTATMIKSTARGDATVPSAISFQAIDFTVNALGTSAFAKLADLTSVTLPETITTLPDHLFEKCTGLTSFTLPAHITELGTYVFAECTNLTDVNLGETITSIPERTFSGCSNLLNVTIPKGLTSFGESAFFNCTKLNTIPIPEGVTGLADYLFYGCKAFDNVVIPDNIKSLGRFSFANCYALANITLPDGLTKLPHQVFYNCIALKHIDIPTSVKILCDYCFNRAAIESIYIHDGVESIGANAFYSCSGLTTIEIPATVTYIGQEAFHYTNKDLVIYMVDPDAIANTITYKNIQCYPSSYPTIYVPCGKAAEYQVKEGWKYAKFVEAPVANQKFEKRSISLNDADTEFSISTEPTFDSAHAQRYIDAHKPLVAANCEVNLQLRKDGDAEWADYAAATDNDLDFIATASGLDYNCKYEYRWQVKHGEAEFVSDIETFTIANLSDTGVDDLLTDNKDEYYIFNTNGICIGSTADTPALTPGVYIVVNSNNKNDCHKIVVR